MAKLEYFIVAESLAMDQATNRVSLFNVLEEIEATKLPSPFPSMVAIAAWNAEDGDSDRDFQQVTTIHLPDGTKLDFPQNFKIPGKRHRVTATFVGVLIAKLGTLKMDIALNGQYKASHIIDVRMAKDAPTQGSK